MYTAPFIGAIIAYAIAGPLSDSSARWMAARNKNIYEPEFRILLVIPMLIISVAISLCESKIYEKVAVQLRTTPKVSRP